MCVIHPVDVDMSLKNSKNNVTILPMTRCDDKYIELIPNHHHHRRRRNIGSDICNVGVVVSMAFCAGLMVGMFLSKVFLSCDIHNNNNNTNRSILLAGATSEALIQRNSFGRIEPNMGLGIRNLDFDNIDDFYSSENNSSPSSQHPLITRNMMEYESITRNDSKLALDSVISLTINRNFFNRYFHPYLMQALERCDSNITQFKSILFNEIVKDVMLVSFYENIIKIGGIPYINTMREILYAMVISEKTTNNAVLENMYNLELLQEMDRQYTSNMMPVCDPTVYSIDWNDKRFHFNSIKSLILAIVPSSYINNDIELDINFMLLRTCIDEISNALIIDLHLAPRFIKHNLLQDLHEWYGKQLVLAKKLFPQIKMAIESNELLMWRQVTEAFLSTNPRDVTLTTTNIISTIIIYSRILKTVANERQNRRNAQMLMIKSLANPIIDEHKSFNTTSGSFNELLFNPIDKEIAQPKFHQDGDLFKSIMNMNESAFVRNYNNNNVTRHVDKSIKFKATTVHPPHHHIIHHQQTFQPQNNSTNDNIGKILLIPPTFGLIIAPLLLCTKCQDATEIIDEDIIIDPNNSFNDENIQYTSSPASRSPYRSKTTTTITLKTTTDSSNEIPKMLKFIPLTPIKDVPAVLAFREQSRHLDKIYNTTHWFVYRGYPNKNIIVPDNIRQTQIKLKYGLKQVETALVRVEVLLNSKNLEDVMYMYKYFAGLLGTKDVLAVSESIFRTKIIIQKMSEYMEFSRKEEYNTFFVTCIADISEVPGMKGYEFVSKSMDKDGITVGAFVTTGDPSVLIISEMNQMTSFENVIHRTDKHDMYETLLHEISHIVVDTEDICYHRTMIGGRLPKAQQARLEFERYFIENKFNLHKSIYELTRSFRTIYQYDGNLSTSQLTEYLLKNDAVFRSNAIMINADTVALVIRDLSARRLADDPVQTFK